MRETHPKNTDIFKQEGYMVDKVPAASNEDLDRLVNPDKNRVPPMLNPELVETLASLVFERVMAKFESASLARRRSGVRIPSAPLDFT